MGGPVKCLHHPFILAHLLPCWRTSFTVVQTLWQLSHVLEPALICAQDRLSMAKLPILMVSGKCQSGCIVHGLLCPYVFSASICESSPSLLLVCHLQHQVSKCQWHICKHPCHQLRVLSQISYVFSFKAIQTCFQMYFVSFSHILAFPTAAGTDHKTIWTAKDVKLNAEHTDGVINTLAWLS